MRVYLNVDGERLPVVNMSLSFNNGLVTSVQVLKGSSYESYYDENYYGLSDTDQKTVNLAECLEYPSIEEKLEKKHQELIEHLDEMHKEENEKLTEIAIEAMEDDQGNQLAGLPFLDKQKEYKLLQQRVFGIIDAIEEVKAYHEGFYAKDAAAETEGE